MKKKTPQGIAMLIVVALGSFFINKYLMGSSAKLTIGAILNIKTQAMNKTTPVKIDNNTIFTKAEYIQPRQLQFNYVFHNIKLDSLNISAFKEYMGVQLEKTVRQDSSFKMLKDSSVIISFQYSDTTGNLIHKFTFTPYDYE